MASLKRAACDFWELELNEKEFGIFDPNSEEIDTSGLVEKEMRLVEK